MSEKYSRRKGRQQEAPPPGTSQSLISEQPSAQAPIHTIQGGESLTSPFFLLHGNWTGGVPFYCYVLARTLGRKLPFHVLDPYIYNGPYKPMSIEEMAAIHLKSLRAIQPEGPYQLGGFCNGSLIVYEMACQLQAEGQIIDLLVLIAPTHVPRVRQVVVHMLHACCDVVRIQSMHQLTGFLRLRHAIRHLYRKFSSPNVLKLQDFPKLLAIDSRLQNIFPPKDALLNDYVGVFTWIASLYKKSLVLENVDFIWAEDELASREAWKEVEKDKVSTILPGHHMQGVTDHVDQLAQILKTVFQSLPENRTGQVDLP